MDQGLIANLKHFYRSGVIKSLVEVIDNNKEPPAYIYISFDDELATCRAITDQSIVNDILNEGNVAEPDP